MTAVAQACVCHTTTGLDDDGRCRRHPVSAWPAAAVAPADDPADGLFPAPAPEGLTPADLDVPDDRWRRNARARRTT